MLKSPDQLKPTRSEGNLLQALLHQLADVPFLEVTEVRKDVEVAGRVIDLILELRLLDGATLRLLGEVKDSGEPRFARAAVDRLYYLTHRTCPGAYGVFLAPYVSPEAASLLKAEGFGYVDLAGNCHLCFGQVYVRKEGRPNTPAQKRVLRSLYSPKAERVLRALLTEPRRGWKLQELATAADVSLGQVHNVKTLLHNREWLAIGPDGLQLRAPEALLRDWSVHYDFSRNTRHTYHSLQEPGQLETTITEICARENLDYAFTGFAAAARIAPHTRYQRLHAYVEPGALEKLVHAAGLKPVTSGANLTLLTPYDGGVYYHSQDRSGRVVSPVQLYLDLRALPGRGEDAAEFLLDTVLRNQW